MAIGYDHGYDAQKLYLGLALNPKYVEGFVEGCLEGIGDFRVRYCTTSSSEAGPAPDFDRMLCNSSGPG